jgi:hypothetical protein
MLTAMTVGRHLYGLGLEHGANRLVDYNSLWPRAFAQEAARIRSALGLLALAIGALRQHSRSGLTGKADNRPFDWCSFKPTAAKIQHCDSDCGSNPSYRATGRTAIGAFEPSPLASLNVCSSKAKQSMA